MDIVIARGSREIAGVEVKASATVRVSDFSGHRKLRDAAGRFTCGIVIYDGETTASFGEGMFAVPIRAISEVA